MWDIPALLQSLVEVWKQKITRSYPEEVAKDLDNQERKDQYEEKVERDKFAARMRRFLSTLKILLVLLTLGCGKVEPNLTLSERQQYQKTLEENIALKDALLECMDHLDKCD